MSNRSDPTGALLLGIGAGLLVFYRGFRQFREYKLVSDTPRINIRSVPMGFVQVRGQAEPRTFDPPSALSPKPVLFLSGRNRTLEGKKIAAGAGSTGARMRMATSFTSPTAPGGY
jgi:hypothetical protein